MSNQGWIFFQFAPISIDRGKVSDYLVLGKSFMYLGRISTPVSNLDFGSVKFEGANF